MIWKTSIKNRKENTLKTLENYVMIVFEDVMGFKPTIQGLNQHDIS